MDDVEEARGEQHANHLRVVLHYHIINSLELWYLKCRPFGRNKWHLESNSESGCKNAKIVYLPKTHPNIFFWRYGEYEIVFIEVVICSKL